MLFLFLAAAAAPASATSLPSSPTVQVAKPDAATVAEAMRLLDTDGFDENAIHSTDLVMGISLAAMVDQLHKQFGDALPEDFVEQLRTTIHDYAMATMRAHLTETKRQAAEIYAQEFTQAELAHLRQLHADPVEVKARERASVMQPKLMMIGLATMRAAQPELDAKIKRMVSDYLAAHGKAGAPNS
jgi:hypothetical protein